jgi:hypothetical protein
LIFSIIFAALTVLYFEFFKTKLTDSNFKKQNDNNSIIKNKPNQKLNVNLKNENVKNVKEDKTKPKNKKNNSKTKTKFVEFSPDCNESSEDEFEETGLGQNREKDIENTLTNPVSQHKTQPDSKQSQNSTTVNATKDQCLDEKHNTSAHTQSDPRVNPPKFNNANSNHPH